MQSQYLGVYLQNHCRCKNYKKKKEDQVEEKKAKVSTTGFNSILACDSVPMAIEYYKELERQMAEPGAPQLRIATIFTSAANEAENDSNGNIEEDPEGIKGLDSTSREFLDSCIAKYNHIFGTSLRREVVQVIVL